VTVDFKSIISRSNSTKVVEEKIRQEFANAHKRLKEQKRED
jgi:hypothetical protein